MLFDGLKPATGVGQYTVQAKIVSSRAHFTLKQAADKERTED